MKTELTTEDRERIEQEAFATFGSGILTYPAFIKGAEYENKYQREEIERLKAKAQFNEDEFFRMRDEKFKLEAERSEMIRFLEWNISSIKHSTASREAQISLEIFQSLFDKLNSLKK